MKLQNLPERVAGTSKVEAQMAVARTEQERQVEVNEAAEILKEATQMQLEAVK